MHRASVAALAIIASLALHSMQTATNAAIIYVDDTATGANTGASWDDAFISLHDGLKIAQAGDEIRIGQGTFKPAAAGSGDRDAAFFLVDGVLMQGGFAGAGAPNPDAYDPEKNPTILSGDIEGNDAPNFGKYADNSYNVVVADGVGPETIVKGLIIRGGNADVYDSNWDDRRSFGAGLHGINGALLVLEDCVISENFSEYGGSAGVRTHGVTLRNCKFISNKAAFGALATPGALSVASGIALVEDCLFQGNASGNYGAAIFSGWSETNAITLRRCKFVGNYSNEAAGAIAGSGYLAVECEFISNVGAHGSGAAMAKHSQFVNCSFRDNDGGCHTFARGSAIGSHGHVAVINCLFSGNEGGSAGTFAVYIQETTDPNLIINCTFIGNSAPWCAGAAVYANAGTVVANTIIWDNLYEDLPPMANPVQASQIRVVEGTILANNIIEGWDGTLGGTNNSGDDPLFIDADGPDDIYGTEDDNPRLSDASPARDAGDNSFLPQDQFDLDEDGNTNEWLPIDLDGLRRIVNGIVDIGAYEWQRIEGCESDVAPSEPGVAGDGNINAADLLIVLNAWGSCDQCVGDINGDGLVNVADLLLVIQGWGACM